MPRRRTTPPDPRYSERSRKGWQTRRGRLADEAAHAGRVQSTVRAAERGNLRAFRQGHETEARTARAAGRLGQEARHVELANAARERERIVAANKRRAILAHEARIERLTDQLRQLQQLPKLPRSSPLAPKRRQAMERLRVAIRGERAAIATIRRAS